MAGHSLRRAAGIGAEIGAALERLPVVLLHADVNAVVCTHDDLYPNGKASSVGLSKTDGKKAAECKPPGQEVVEGARQQAPGRQEHGPDRSARAHSAAPSEIVCWPSTWLDEGLPKCPRR
jgi:hypothetical protein